MKRFIITGLIVLFISSPVFAQHLKLLSPPILNLGDVPVDTVISGKIEFMNDGDAVLKISKIETSCGCTMAKLKKMTYLPGEKGTVRITFNTKGYRGPTRKYITFYLTDATPPSVRVTMVVNVHQNIEITPRFVSFKDLKISNMPRESEFTIYNHYPHSVKVRRVKSTESRLTATPETFTIPAGDSVKVKLRYLATKAEAKDAIVLVEFENPPKLVKRVPVFIKVAP